MGPRPGVATVAQSLSGSSAVPEDDLQALLRTGIEAAESGRPGVARGIFDRVIARDPDHEIAWLWKATVAETLDERRACLRRVLVINPENAQAGQALEELRRQTPSLTRRKASAPADRDERAALLASAEAPRRPRRVLPFALIAIALALMTVGTALIVRGQRETPAAPDATATPRPDRTATWQALSGPFSGTVTLPPEPIRTLPRRRDELPPTWTPTATWTPPPARTPSPGDAETPRASG